MEIDPRFPIKLDAISDVPEPLRTALIESVPSGESVRLLVHSPAFLTATAKSPATVLAITSDGWFVCSEKEDGGAAIEKCDFRNTLFFELTSILLSGRLKIFFASVGTSYAATIKFNTVEERLYREAIDIMLAGIDPVLAETTARDPEEVALLESWPIKFRDEANLYWPKGQHLRTAIQWPAIVGGFERELVPAGALLVTEREIVLISEEKESPRQVEENFYESGAVVTFFPRLRLTDFHVGHHDRFGILALQVHAAHGGEKLEVVFPSQEELAVSKAMESFLLAR
ncbi:MAG TPA: hypothetical protein VE860_24725 [Chthoniobacterales bacterium]|jgi:hypothetical protein|nr:hypothetical protein [Chthoniobacterales bacterium]